MEKNYLLTYFSNSGYSCCGWFKTKEELINFAKSGYIKPTAAFEILDKKNILNECK